MATSYLLTENSKVIFTIGTAVSTPTLLSEKTTTLNSSGYEGTITWDLDTSKNNSVLGHKVVLKVKDITPSIKYNEYVNPTKPATSTSVSGENISNIKMDTKIPLCEKDSGSVNGSCYYMQGNDPQIHNYTCNIAFSANQTVTKGYVPDPEP